MDLSVTKFTHTLPISSISVASLDPFILKISGDDFFSARDILINGTPVSRFELLGRGVVLAEVPLSLQDDLIHTLSVVSSGPVRATTSSSVDLSLGDMSTSVSGIAALTQRFLKVLLTTPRSSYEHPDEGGGVYGLLGDNIDDGVSGDLLSAAVDGVSEYLAADPHFFKLPSSERLSSAEVVQASVDKDAQTVSVSIRITNHLGESSTSEVDI